MKSRSRWIVGATITLILMNMGMGTRAEPSQTDLSSVDDATGIDYDTVGNLFQEAITYESGDFFRNLSVGEQLQVILGVGGSRAKDISAFPENQIARDTLLVDTLYQDYLDQQAGVAIRTRNLKNPYNTSLRALTE